MPAVRAVAAARAVADSEYRSAARCAGSYAAGSAATGPAKRRATFRTSGGRRARLHLFDQGLIAHGAAAQCNAENFDAGAGQAVCAADRKSAALFAGASAVTAVAAKAGAAAKSARRAGISAGCAEQSGDGAATCGAFTVWTMIE